MIPTNGLPAALSGVEVDLVNDPVVVDDESTACALKGEPAACDGLPPPPPPAADGCDDPESTIRKP